MTFLLNELLYRCYDCFSSLIKFWSGERYIEIMFCILMKKVIIMSKIQVTVKTFIPSFNML